MNDQVKEALKKYTKLELATIVAELTANEDTGDIYSTTGLKMEQCAEIIKIGHHLGQALGR